MSDAPKLVLAGLTAPTASDLCLAQELGIEDKIELRIDIPRDQLLELYQGATVLMLSSDEEGLGMVLLEAMACGLPVVATRCGGPETVVDDGKSGFLTPVRDAEAMAAAVRQLLLAPSSHPLDRCAADRARRFTR
jgi:glycosyltransferase involved in cell wall biosynthesis